MVLSTTIWNQLGLEIQSYLGWWCQGGHGKKNFYSACQGRGRGGAKSFLNGHNDVDDAKPYNVDYNDDIADADVVENYDDDAGMPKVG